MPNILVQIVNTDTPLPAGVVFGHKNLVVTDSAALVQTFVLTGAETPPWSQTASVAIGDGSVTVTDVDSNGNTLGTPVSQKFTATATTFPATTSVTVTMA